MLITRKDLCVRINECYIGGTDTNLKSNQDELSTNMIRPCRIYTGFSPARPLPLVEDAAEGVSDPE